jgi:voltage-gated potassium channel
MTKAMSAGELSLPVQFQEKIEAWASKTFSDEPFTKLVGMVMTGALLFYRAEVGHNPKVKSYADALIYCSTCASVGYGDIFAVTPVGKLVGSVIMTVGPAMANSAFFGGKFARENERKEAEATQKRILVTLEKILSELEKR